LCKGKAQVDHACAGVDAGDNRRSKLLRRRVVAIDPAVSTGEDSDESGIIVAGLGDDGRGYVLEDLSGRFAPAEWAARAIGAFNRRQGFDG
jgi:phage terminase large subunit-like protein